MGPETEDEQELETCEVAPGSVPEIEESRSSETEESCSSNMSNLMEPPAFISNKKLYATYKKDLMRWTTLTTLAEEKLHFLFVLPIFSKCTSLAFCPQ